MVRQFNTNTTLKTFSVSACHVEEKAIDIVVVFSVPLMEDIFYHNKDQVLTFNYCGQPQYIQMNDQERWDFMRFINECAP